MRAIVSIAAIMALNSASLLHAAQDPSTVMPLTRGQTGMGAGAQAGVTVRLGNRQTVRDENRVRLSVSAGPMLAIRDARAQSGIRRSIVPLGAFTLNPGRSARFDLAGVAVAEHLTPLGAAEKEKEERDGKKKGPSTIGWVAIGTGAAALIGATVFVLMLADAADCSDGECE